MKKNILLFVIFIISITTYSQCITSDYFTSCAKTLSNHIDRGEGYWIQYNFGSEIKIDAIELKNLFFSDGQYWGVKDVFIDYSLDGENWEPLNESGFEISQKESNEIEADFDDVNAVFLLFTIKTTWGEESETELCSGLKFVDITYSEKEALSLNNENVQELSTEITIYPNPTSDVLNIKTNLKINSFILSSIDGKILLQGAYNTTINVHTLEKGFYVLTLYGNDSNYSQRVFVN